jgi:hypothetical protein
MSFTDFSNAILPFSKTAISTDEVHGTHLKLNSRCVCLLLRIGFPCLCSPTQPPEVRSISQPQKDLTRDHTERTGFFIYFFPVCTVISVVEGFLPIVAANPRYCRC